MQKVQALVEANPDPTLDELRAEMARACGVAISRSTMCRVMKRLQFTRKKKPFTPVTRPVNGYSDRKGVLGWNSRCPSRRLDIYR